MAHRARHRTPSLRRVARVPARADNRVAVTALTTTPATDAINALLAAEHATVSDGTNAWEIDRGRLIAAGPASGALAFLPVSPPDPPAQVDPPGHPIIDRNLIDEVLCLARWFDRRAGKLTVTTTGEWRFPLLIDDEVPGLRAA